LPSESTDGQESESFRTGVVGKVGTIERAEACGRGRRQTNEGKDDGENLPVKGETHLERKML
jgi:hypothetical protein